MFHSLKTLVENQIQTWWTSFFGDFVKEIGVNPSFGATRLAAVDNAFQKLSQGHSFPRSDSAGVEMTTAPSPIAKTLAAKASDAPSSVVPQSLLDFADEVGLDPKSKVQLPETNPLTLQKINWDEEISQNNLKSLSRDSQRQANLETLSDDVKINRLIHLVMLALQTGNISLAMLLFSHLESTSANQLTKCLMEKVQSLQQHKRDLAKKIQDQPNDAAGSKTIESLRNDMEDANDDISVLQTFIRDVAQNKQNSVELANAFISKEEETGMAIVRSFAR